MMNKLKIFSLTLSLTCALSAIAQTDLGSKVEVCQPKYITDKVYFDDAKRIEQWDGSNGGDGYWNVISDRVNNKTYTEPRSGAPVYGTLDFNQPVRIAKVSNGYGLVYTDGQDIRYPEISKKAQSLGWVPLKNLLLWTRCPMNSYGIYDKALIAVNLDEIPEGGEYDDSKKNMVLLDPNSDENAKYIKGQNIYFVMKEQLCDDGKKRLLLANVSRLEGLDVRHLLGWINEANISRWTQRSCLEREWRPRQLENYLDGEVINVYNNYDHMGSSSPIWKWSLAKNDTRADGNLLRFPILDDKAHPDLFKMTIYGAVGGDVKATRQEQEHAERKMNEALADLRKINIILVIDGTESMKNYYQPVKVAIRNAIDKHLKEFDEVKVGAVIYRDSINGKYLTEVCTMKDPNDPRLSDFLDNGGEYGITRTPADRTMEEDMYTGIYTALDWKKMGYLPNEANVMILVGDCGNDREDEEKWHDLLIDKLRECNMQLIGFQVNSSNVGAYNYFRYQVQKLIKENIDNQYGAMAENIFGPNPKLGKFKEYPDMSGRYYEFPKADGDGGRFFFGAVRYPREDGPADPAEIGQLVVDNIEKNAEASRKQYESFAHIYYNNEPDETTYGQFDEEFVINRVGRQVYNNFKKNNTTMAVTGYSKRVNRDGRSLWRPVVFISEGELNSLMGDLKKVYNAAYTKNRDRSQYVDALSSVVKAMIPEAKKASDGADEESIKKTTLGEITAMIGGLNVQTDALGSEYSLVDLLDPKVVSDEDFNGILNDFTRKYDRLIDTQRKKDCVKQFGSETYYWIPVDDLP